MGRNESTVELLVKVWAGIREILEVPNESTGSFFRHMRVLTQRVCWGKCVELNIIKAVLASQFSSEWATRNFQQVT